MKFAHFRPWGQLKGHFFAAMSILFVKLVNHDVKSHTQCMALIFVEFCSKKGCKMFALGQFHFTDHWKDPKMHQNRNTLLGNTELQNKKEKVIKRNSESLAQFKHLGELDSADHWRNQEMHLMHLFTILIWTIFQFCQISWRDLDVY